MDSSTSESSRDENEKTTSLSSSHSAPSRRNPSFSSSPSASSSPATESSSQGTANVSIPLNTQQQAKTPPSKMDGKMSTPSKPSSSLKRTRERESKDATKPLSETNKTAKMKETEKKSEGEVKGKKKAVSVPEGEKSAKKSGPVWNPKDVLAFLTGLAAAIEKGMVWPKNLMVFYDQIRSELDGEYSNEQLYNKYRGIRQQFITGKVIRIKNVPEETVEKLCAQIWGDGDQKTGKKSVEKVMKEKTTPVKDGEGEEKVVKEKTTPVKDGGGEEKVVTTPVKDGEGEERVLKEKTTPVKEKKQLKRKKSVKVVKVVANGAAIGSNKVAATEQHDVARESTMPVGNKVSNESTRVATVDQPERGGNSTSHDSDGMENGSRSLQLVYRLVKENSKIIDDFMSEVSTENPGMLNELKDEMMKMVKSKLQCSSNTTRMDAGLEFMRNGVASAAQLTQGLSAAQVEMLRGKWQIQECVELEAASKHLALLQEAIEVRLAKLRRSN